MNAVAMPLPPVERVRPGLWSIPVPLPNNSLRYVLVYAVRDRRRAVPRRRRMEHRRGLRRPRRRPRRGGLRHDRRPGRARHPHPPRPLRPGRPDPARRRGRGSRCTRPTPRLIHDRYEEPDDLLGRVGADAAPDRAPPAEERRRCSRRPCRCGPSSTSVRPTCCSRTASSPRCRAGTSPPSGRPATRPATSASGSRANRLMLSGDHVLPRITPNIPFHPQAGDDPLGDYLASLDKLRAVYDADEVLPAHEHRFVGLHGRLDQLRRTTSTASSRCSPPSRDGVDTAWGIAARMHWSRSWDRSRASCGGPRSARPWPTCGRWWCRGRRSARRRSGRRRTARRSSSHAEGDRLLPRVQHLVEREPHHLRHHVEHRDRDDRAPAGPLAVVQGGEHAGVGVERRADVGDRDPGSAGARAGR